MLHFLDQQVGLHFRDVIKNVLLHVIGARHLRRYFEPESVDIGS
jgi:hypothetical protein